MIKAIWTAAESRAADAQTVDSGLPWSALLSNAGFQLGRYLQHVIPTGRIIIMTGPGLNGADGWIAARYLARDRDVTVVPIEEPRFEGANHWIRSARCAGVTIYEESMPTAGLARSAAGIVDAIYGIGLNRSIAGTRAYEWLKWANEIDGPLVAVDILTGIDADTGTYSGPDIQVHSTFAMGQAKWGHIGYPGAGLTGQLVVGDIGLLSSNAPTATWIDPDQAQRLFPTVGGLSHKYGRGHVVVIGGSRAMPGAPVLAATAALVAGAGLVEIIMPESARNLVPTPAALIAHGVRETADGHLAMSDIVMERARRADAIVFGPGLGKGVPVRLLSRLLDLNKPMVIDADAIGMARQAISWRRFSQVAFTPHAGELGGLLDCSAKAVNQDRKSAIETAVRMLGAPVLLKGRYSLIGDGDHIYVNPTGSVALATAGSGDVLSGIVGRLMAKGLSSAQALCLGAYWHGLSGDLGEQHKGLILQAMDIIDFLAPAARLVQSGAVPMGLPMEWG